jgi:pyruvate formate lyase activating enzyme
MESGTEVKLRIPLIPGKNDDPEHLSELMDFIRRIKRENLTEICLLPFHRTGESKYRKLNLCYRMNSTEQPSPGRMRELKDFFSTTGIRVKIGG